MVYQGVGHSGWVLLTMHRVEAVRKQGLGTGAQKLFRRSVEEN